jgi:hypothetical protein
MVYHCRTEGYSKERDHHEGLWPFLTLFAAIGYRRQPAAVVGPRVLPGLIPYRNLLFHTNMELPATKSLMHTG